MSGNRECSSGGSRGADVPGGRRAALRARTRDEILDAAAELVTERGVDELNLNELAVRAGFASAASLYRYFAGKREIVSRLAARDLERLGEYLQRVPADLPLEEQIVEICLAYLDYACERPGTRALLLTTASSIATEFRAAALPAEIVGRMFRLGEAARETGALNLRDKDDIFAVLHAGWALAHGMAEYDRMYEGPERDVLRERHRAVFKAYVAGFKSDWTG
ncbi:MAG TPA: TetR/AcrR family transcriptional regulator [Thermoleophilia bacterium]|nr:TetR/AcrR family transcriptional regulator [Thermoleophilia bacterium]